jgi:single-stranded-DNA-specific exonuclease
MLLKDWVVAPSAAPDFLRQFRGMSPHLAQVLINRGFETPEDAYRFLYAKDVTHNPFDMTDMDKAVGRIRRAIKNHEAIAIYGDFDADGVTSTTLLVQALRALNANVRPYIPHRVDEGYGLNREALQKLAKSGVKLVVTVDCGIRSIDEIEDGKAIGLDIIVTDHHSLGPELPDAFAIVNCKHGDYPEPMLAGVGVAFKLVQALIMAERRNSKPNGNNQYAGVPLAELYDLVAIGTVADLMPLDRLENRVLIRRGLEALNKAERPGVRALLEVAGLQPGSITASSIGFTLGPRINAAGRMGDAIFAYNLLSAPNMTEAKKWADELQRLNTDRQEITRTAQNEVSEWLEQEETEGKSLIFYKSDTFSPGIVGLVAGRLTEEFFRPAIIMEQGETESRASCRSIPQFDITNALDQCADLLVRHGGHALAAGFTVTNENIPALRERITQLAEETLKGQTLRSTLNIDLELNIHALTRELVDELQLLEPCGSGNTQPIFMVRNVHVAEHRTVGKDARHLKLRLSRASQPPMDAIGFGLGGWANHMPDRIDMAFQLEVNEWQGRKRLQANLKDIREATSR